uniref:CSON002311 protein n=1 Tax=Culicoides sonorensis TaxID=179676 RepID=A0A336MPU9_CULSO
MATNFVDNLVKEFLIFRGFSGTLKQFDAELKSDKDQSFRADKIVDQIMMCINTQDLDTLVQYMNHLNCNLFSKLEQSFAGAVKKLQQGIYKLYLVMAYNNNKSDKITEFFQKMSSELQGVSEWKDWFFFPFCKNPEEHSTFSLYFTKQWQDTLLISLHNFLATIFQCMPQPTLTRAEAEVCLIKRLQDENSLLRNRIQTLQSQQVGQVQGHQSRLSSFNNQEFNKKMGAGTLTLNDIIPLDISPPPHIVDDFFIIAAETLGVVNNASETQAKGLKSLIRNISSGGSPVMGRKDGTSDKNKRRSGSVGGNKKD